MKYSIEIENGIAKETLVFNGKVYVKTTKKTVAPKKTTVKKPAKKVETKIEVKKETKVDTKVKKEKVKVPFKERVKRFFNSPQPLIVILAIMVVGLLIYNIQITINLGCHFFLQIVSVVRLYP